MDKKVLIIIIAGLLLMGTITMIEYQEENSIKVRTICDAQILEKGYNGPIDCYDYWIPKNKNLIGEYDG